LAEAGAALYFKVPNDLPGNVVITIQ